MIRALSQLDDPTLLGVLWRSLALAALSFGALVLLSFWGLHHVLATYGWAGWLAGAAGGVLATLAAFWLFLPVAVVIATLFLEPVCRAVERRWYPGLAPASGAGLAAQGWDGISLGLLVLVLNLASLLLALLLPGVGLLLGWAITAWALGRGFFTAVAMRRMSRSEALREYARHRPAVLIQGAALALAGSVPLLNLLVPVLGPAAMVHILASPTRAS